jgi:hypothetical protein
MQLDFKKELAKALSGIIPEKESLPVSENESYMDRVFNTKKETD